METNSRVSPQQTRAGQISNYKAYPDFNNQTGIGLTLAQIVDGAERVVPYAGRDLNPAERNYNVTEREALEVIDGIKCFQPYLQGQKFTIHTDHHALRWLMSLEDPTGRLARWSLLIQQCDFDIVHRPGAVNGNADAPSRRPYGTYSLNALETTGFQAQQIFNFQRHDPNLTDLIDYLECDQLPQDNTRAKRVLLSEDIYLLDANNLLYHIDVSDKRGRNGCHAQLVLPPPLRYEIWVNAHHDLAGGHLGVYKTYEKLRDRYYWRGMYKDVEHWI